MKLRQTRSLRTQVATDRERRNRMAPVKKVAIPTHSYVFHSCSCLPYRVLLESALVAAVLCLGRSLGVTHDNMPAARQMALRPASLQHVSVAQPAHGTKAGRVSCAAQVAVEPPIQNARLIAYGRGAGR